MLTVEEALKVLTRKRIATGQINLFRLLYETEWMSGAAIANLMRDGDLDSLRSVLGALGNRVNQTEELETGKRQGIDPLLERKRWGRGPTHYRMRPELRQAIDRLAELRDVMMASSSRALL